MMNILNSLNVKLNAFREKYGVPGSFLKWLAVISMLVDHTAATVVRRYSVLTASSQSAETARFLKLLYRHMRRFGRLAFPIYCFLLLEGFLHTRDRKKYAMRLFLFALISEYPFDYALHNSQPLMTKQNVFFTLFIGMAVLIGIAQLQGRIMIQLMIMAAGLITARLLKTDYSYHGIFLIETLYITRFSRFFQSGCGAAYMQYYEKMPTPLAFIPVYFYNGKRGRQHKYFFYLFYPVHLIILGIIANEILPRIIV